MGVADAMGGAMRRYSNLQGKYQGCLVESHYSLEQEMWHTVLYPFHPPTIIGVVVV